MSASLCHAGQHTNLRLATELSIIVLSLCASHSLLQWHTSRACSQLERWHQQPARRPTASSPASSQKRCSSGWMQVRGEGGACMHWGYRLLLAAATATAILPSG